VNPTMKNLTAPFKYTFSMYHESGKHIQYSLGVSSTFLCPALHWSSSMQRFTFIPWKGYMCEDLVAPFLLL